ncbi:unnamed protein product [Zymoseptoria tritici ST99CH_1A5]|uniref:Ferric oxidoreductase domain-containing protein n=1 Tax=Zymoseptoria tritici ST99CH_1A5 TaxID=1276529 RepID=A0A1Y6LFQ0_ZYMTR|nr:unnamed protein product [Zymoseptoria tritici ST99CH_1A5]
MGMVLLPVSRHSALVSFFKLSPATTYSFHMFQAYVLFALVAIHGSLYADWASIWDARFRPFLPILNPTYYYHETWPGNRSSLGIWRASLIFTGIASSLIMVVIFFSSLPVVRRKYFNVFYFCHLLAILAVVIVCLHASTMFYCTLPGLAMWLLDWSMRFVELRVKLDSKLTALGNGWYSLKLPLPRKRLSGCACHSPLAHFHIHHSDSSIIEIHPFTTITHLASKKAMMTDQSSIEIEFLFREMPARRAGKRSQWTNRVGALVDVEALRVPPVMDGEKSPTSNAMEQETSTIDLSVATTMRLEGPYFTPANPEQYETVICIVAGTGVSGALAIAAAFQSSTVGSLWKRCVIIWTVRETDFVDLPNITGMDREGLEFKVHKTGKGLPRLDVRTALVDICGEKTSSAWCYISGPNAFISAAERACNQVGGLEMFAARWG